MKNILLILLVVLLGFSSCVTNDTIIPQAQFKKDTVSISSYLIANGIAATKILPGIWYAFDSVGTGLYPVLSDSITVSYAAFLLPSLKKVDSAKSITALLSTTMAGWQAALPMFTVGSSGRIYIPSGLAFGQFQHDSIPPNSNLLYKIELLAVKGTKLQSDVQSIDTYLGLIADSLATENYTVVDHPSGIRYYYDTLYQGNAHPSYSSSITVNCTGRIMGSKSLFLNATDTTLLLKNQMAAWKIVLTLPQITEGSTVTFYVPSGYGYGSSAVGTKIPANSNLTYQVKIIKVNN